MSEDFVRTSTGELHAASLYGYGEDGAQMFSAEAHAQSPRAQKLARSEAYFRNRQHDDKMYSWGGCLLPRFEPGHQPYLSTTKVDNFIPLEQRRPCAPYRLPKFIVRSFTTLLFGEGRSPEIRVVGDPDTQDYADALAKSCDLFAVFEHARDVGGSSGTVGVSWRFWEGRPRLQVHPGSTVYVQRWADREELVPEVVTSCIAIDKEVYDEKEKRVVTKRHWRRRDWTPTADVAFVDQLVDARDKEWVLDVEATYVHGEGFAHFRWVSNRRDYDGTSPDGEADYAGVEEVCDAIDVAFSATMYGGAKNIEPTLMLMLDEALLSKIQRVHKGADRALPVGKGGDARYLELSGSSITTGLSLVDRARAAVLETVQVLAPDPDKVAAAGSSSVALKMLYAPMLAPAAVLRQRYGAAIVGLLSDMIRSIRFNLEPPEVDEGSFTDRSVNVAPEEGEEPSVEVAEEEVELYVDLPPRVVEEQVKDPATGLPTGEKRVTVAPRRLGRGGEIELAWPDWFPLTAADRAQETATLSTAAGGRAVLSHKSAVEKAAQIHGVDPAEEWREVSAQVQAEREAQTEMFPSAGLPPEAAPASGGVVPDQGQAAEAVKVPDAGGAEIELTATDLATIVTVNEGRRSIGLGPLTLADGSPDPDGDLTITEYKAKRAPVVAEAADAEAGVA